MYSKDFMRDGEGILFQIELISECSFDLHFVNDFHVHFDEMDLVSCSLQTILRSRVYYKLNFINLFYGYRFPSLWLTADFSHWTVVCERLFSGSH